MTTTTGAPWGGDDQQVEMADGPRPILPPWTAESLAEALGVHPETIRVAIRQGRLKAFKAVGRWRMYDEDVHAFCRAEPSAAEPPSPPPADSVLPQRGSRRRKLY